MTQISQEEFERVGRALREQGHGGEWAEREPGPKVSTLEAELQAGRTVIAGGYLMPDWMANLFANVTDPIRNPKNGETE